MGKIRKKLGNLTFFFLFFLKKDDFKILVFIGGPILRCCCRSSRSGWCGSCSSFRRFFWPRIPTCVRRGDGHPSQIGRSFGRPTPRLRCCCQYDGPGWSWRLRSSCHQFFWRVREGDHPWCLRFVRLKRKTFRFGGGWLVFFGFGFFFFFIIYFKMGNLI